MTALNLLKEFRTAEAEARHNQTKTLQKIIEVYGNQNNFRKAMPNIIINRPGCKDFQELYDFYSTFFTLPNESETFEGFTRALELNKDEYLIQLYGRFEETWIYLRSPIDNKIIAGINFSTYMLPEQIASRNNIGGTCHVIYLFVKVEYRSLGIARFLHSEAENYSLRFCDNKGPIWMICEQNAPELMTYEEYLHDNLNALIDQCERLKWWDNLGYKRLNFNYIQPPLNPEMDYCHNLTLNIRSEGQSEIPSEVIAEHLQRFFSIAVFKGRDANSDPVTNNQLEMLKNLGNVRLSGNEEYYAELKRTIYDKNILWQPTLKLFDN